MKCFNQIATILTKQITAIRLFTGAFTSSCNPSTYLTHGSRVCSASLQFNWLYVFTGCRGLFAVFAVVSGNWRSLAVVCGQAFNDVYAVRCLWIEFCFTLLGGG